MKVASAVAKTRRGPKRSDSQLARGMSAATVRKYDVSAPFAWTGSTPRSRAIGGNGVAIMALSKVSIMKVPEISSSRKLRPAMSSALSPNRPVECYVGLSLTALLALESSNARDGMTPTAASSSSPFWSAKSRNKRTHRFWCAAENPDRHYSY
jgi:hypothetical protein